MKNLKKISVLLVILIFASIRAFSEQSSDTAPRYALVIGNQTYDQSALKNPVADAKLLASALKNCGFDVTLMTDLNQIDMRKGIADYAEKVGKSGKNSISLFYYSGHGVQIDGKNYMVPIDDKEIVNAVRAKSICYPIDDVFGLVPSGTQIVILDACRNNPFSSSKELFQKGLSRIANPKNVTNFISFFSTSDGATADDGSGKNSLFSQKLAWHVENDFNTPVSVVFNSVAGDVKEATNGRQTPLITGTGVSLEFINSEIMSAKIKALQNSAKASEKKGGSAKITSDSEKKLMEAEIAMLEKRKAEAEKDAKAKAEKKKKEESLQQKNKKEMERMQKEAEKQRKEFQSAKAKEKSSLAFIGEIEDNKEALQKIRISAADKIYAANKATQSKTDAKIAEINDAPLRSSEKDAKGRINSATKKRRNAEIKVIENENALEKQKNFDAFYEKIQTEEAERASLLNADEQTLRGAVYTASSVFDEVEFTVSEYDGEKNQWTITLNSNILGKKDLFSTTVTLPYKELCTEVLKKKFVEPKKMDTDAFNQYSDDIDTYEMAFHGKNPPLILEVDYKVSPSSSPVSSYVFSGQNVRVIFMQDENPVLNKKSFSSSGKITWEKKQTEVKTVQAILKEYEKRDAKELKEKQKAEKKAVR